MCALYAFLRLSDDVADGPGAIEPKRFALSTWRSQFGAALEGRYSHPCHPALHDIVLRYSIPRQYLVAALDGVEMDLHDVAMATFEELYRYCYHVASVVGLACIHIWGFSDDKAKEYAENAGIAFQLTNILRDLAEDAQRDRVYLPREDLDRFGYEAEQLRRGERNDRFQALMQFEVKRARRYYDASMPLTNYLTPPGRAVFQVMSRTYRGLLDAIEGSDYDVFSRRVRLSSWRKLAFALQALPVRWGILL
jgi:phytoene synthase